MAKIIIVGGEPTLAQKIAQAIVENQQVQVVFGRGCGKTHFLREVEQELKLSQQSEEHRNYLAALREKEECQAVIDEIIEEGDEQDSIATFALFLMESIIEDMNEAIANYEQSKAKRQDRGALSYSDCFTRRFTAPYKHDLNKGGELVRVGDFIDLISGKTYTESEMHDLHRKITNKLSRLGIVISDINDVMLNDIINGLQENE